MKEALFHPKYNYPFMLVKMSSQGHSRFLSQNAKSEHEVQYLLLSKKLLIIILTEYSNHDYWHEQCNPNRDCLITIILDPVSHKEIDRTK